MTLLSALALLFLLLGTYLLSEGLHVWDAGLFILLSLLVLVVLIGRQHSRRGREYACRTRLRAWLRSLIPGGDTGTLVTRLRSGAVVAALAVAIGVRTLPRTADFTIPFVIWLIAIGVFVASLFVPVQGRIVSGRRFLGEARERAWALVKAPEAWALGLLLLVAGLLRGLALGRAPANLGGDEGTQLLAALRLVGMEGAGRGMSNPFATGWYSVPTMSFAAYGLAMRLFGATIAGGRALSAIAGTLTVLTTYWIARMMGGRRVGWVGALLLTFSAYHIHYSRLASNQIFDPLIGTAALGWLWLALQPRRAEGHAGGDSGAPPSVRTAWGLAGVTAGLGWYAYFGARWVSFLIAMTIVLWYLFDPSLIRRHWRGFLLFGLGWLIVVLPLFGWYSVRPSAFSERYQAVSVFASGWFARELELTGKPAIVLLLQQVWRSVTAFHLTPDTTFWYRPERPLVDFITGALLLLGLADAGVRLHWPSRRLALLWFWSTLAMAWVLTENPPSSQRGLLLAPVVAICASWGLQRAASLLRLHGKRSAYLAGTVLLVIGVLNVTFYFGEHVPSRVYGNPTAETATVLAHHVLAHPEPVCLPDPALACPGYVYMLGPQWLYWDFGTLAFMLRRFPGESVPQDTLVDWATGPARFVVVPERLAELEMLRYLYPGGTETALYGTQDRLLVVVYDWWGVTPE